MTHDYHEGQPNFSAHQILKDGCAECKQRSENVELAISHMDKFTFIRAWGRAELWARAGLPDGSHAEMPVIRTLRAIQVRLTDLHLLA